METGAKIKEDEMTETRKEYTEEEKREWRLDPEQSFAEFEITAVQFPGRIAYSFTDRLQINPYPNPTGFGGMFGTGGAGSVPDLMEHLRSWREMLRPWEARGLTRIRIIRQPPIYRAEPTRAEQEIATENVSPKLVKKAKAGQMSLL